MRYRPRLSLRTMTVILVLEFCASTKEPINGAPSGRFTMPVMVAPLQNELKESKRAKDKSVLERTCIGVRRGNCIRSFQGKQFEDRCRRIEPVAPELSAGDEQLFSLKGSRRPYLREKKC